MRISKEELQDIIAEVVEDAGYELVEMKLGRHGKRHQLRVFAYKSGGITLDQCGELSRALSRRLDDEDPFEDAYILEVSSPGLNRKLITSDDFRRAVGENVRLQLDDPALEEKQIEGRLADVENDGLTIETSKGVVELSVGSVKLGKIVY